MVQTRGRSESMESGASMSTANNAAGAKSSRKSVKKTAATPKTAPKTASKTASKRNARLTSVEEEEETIIAPSTTQVAKSAAKSVRKNVAKSAAKSAAKKSSKAEDHEVVSSKKSSSPARKRSLSTASSQIADESKAKASNGVSSSKKRARSNSMNGNASHGSAAIPFSLEAAKKQEFQVHRCRFISWVPFAITAMAASPSGSQLAVTRENGAIEVWEVKNQKWHQSVLVPGKEEPGMSGTVLALVWAGKDRLFGSDMDGSVFEIDLVRQARVRETSSFGGAVWCMSASEEEDKTVIAMGCEDGRVRIFEVLPGQGSGLNYVRAFRSVATGRILTIKYHPAEDQRHIVYTGGVDGLIRKWDSTSGQVVLQIATESYGKSEPICLWTLAVLKDSTLISGDSDGHVHVWDSRDEAGTLIRSFHEHRADVTTLAVSKDENTVFASGIDSRVAMFRRIPASESTGVEDWVYGYSHRPHSRDVRGLAIVDNGKILASGGNDTQICWYPVDSFAKARPARLGPFLHRQLVHVARAGKLLATQHAHHIEIWRTKAQDQLAALRFKGRMGIRCSALAPSGTLFACADDAGLKIFHFDANEDEEFGVQRLSEVETALVSGDANVSVRSDGAVVAVSFVASGDKGDNLFVYAFQSGRVCVAKISGKGGEVQNDANAVSIEASWAPVSAESKSAAVKELAVSSDGRWVAIGTTAGHITVYDVSTKKIQMEIARALTNGSLFTAMAFQPKSAVLAVANMKNEFFLFDVKAQKLSPWSLAAGDRLDPQLLKQLEAVIGITFDPVEIDMMILWGRTYACKVPLGDMPHELEGHEAGSLRFNFLTRFKPLMHMECTDESEMVVVEAPWLKVMQNFQDPIKRKVYGGAT